MTAVTPPYDQSWAAVGEVEFLESTGLFNSMTEYGVPFGVKKYEFIGTTSTEVGTFMLGNFGLVLMLCVNIIPIHDNQQII